jgi:pseudouridine kinase
MRNGNILFDAVSGLKLTRVLSLINGINTVKLNSIEAGILSGINIKTANDTEKAADIISGRNIDNVFITRGAEGSIYSRGENRWRRKPKSLSITNSTGAGDAFMAGIAYGMFYGKKGGDLLKTASICASFAAASEKTVPENLTSIEVERIFQGDMK